MQPQVIVLAIKDNFPIDCKPFISFFFSFQYKTINDELQVPNGITTMSESNGNLSETTSNLVSSGAPSSPHVDSVNGELNSVRWSAVEDKAAYFPTRRYAYDYYYGTPSRVTFAPESVPLNHNNNIEACVAEDHMSQHKYSSYSCEENLQKYHQRCRDEYYRCSDNNFLHNHYSFETAQPVKYPPRYSDVSFHELCKFPQRKYSEQSLQHLPKYNNSQCSEHSKYSTGAFNFLPNKVLPSMAIPMIGHTAMEMVVNNFDSTSSMLPNVSYANTRHDRYQAQYLRDSNSDNEDV